MTHGSIPTGTKPGEAPFRILCGSLMLGLSLICVYSSFSRAIQGTGGEAVTSWIYFAWGCATAIGGVWVIRGRSKGQPIVFARDRKRLILVASLAVFVAGMLIVLAVQFSTTDEEWPFLLQTMFAVLFASVLFLLFEREDSTEQTAPKPLTAAGRRKARRLLIVMVLVGALTLATGLAAGVQADSWWQEGLSRLGTALLAAAAVLGYRLKSNR